MNSDISYWQKKLEKYSNEDWSQKPSIFATQVVQYFPKPGHILELGAGLGQDAIFFAQEGYKVTSCDLTDLANERIPKEFRKNIAFKVVDLSQPLPIELDSFDVVYSHLALHYFDKTRMQQLFEEIYKVLKVGGIFATLTNTQDDPEISEFEKIEDDYYVTPDGLKKRYFSVDSLGQFTSKYKILLLDAKGETYKDKIKTLIRFVGEKIAPISL